MLECVRGGRHADNQLDPAEDLILDISWRIPPEKSILAWSTSKLFEYCSGKLHSNPLHQASSKGQLDKQLEVSHVLFGYRANVEKKDMGGMFSTLRRDTLAAPNSQ